MTMPFEEMPEYVQDFIRELGIDPDQVDFLEITPEQAKTLFSQDHDPSSTHITRVLSDRSHEMWHKEVDPAIDRIARYIMAQYASWVALEPSRVHAGMMDHEQAVVEEIVEKVAGTIQTLITDTLANYVEPEFAHLIVNLGNRCGELSKRAIVEDIGAAMYNIWSEYLAMGIGEEE